jgi:hypothetical protein
MPDGTLVLPLHQPHTVSDWKLFHTPYAVCIWHHLTPTCLHLRRKVSKEFHSHVMKMFKRWWKSDFEKSLKCSKATGSKKLVQWWWHWIKQEGNYVEKWHIETKHKIWAVFCVLLHFNNLSGSKEANMKALLLKHHLYNFRLSVSITETSCVKHLSRFDERLSVHRWWYEESKTN